MPDSIALYSADGTDYLVTANEGDSESGEITLMKLSVISKMARLPRQERSQLKTAA